MGDSGGPIKAVHTGRIRIDYARGVFIVTGQDGVDQLLAGVGRDGRVTVDLAPDGVDVKTAELKDLVWSSRTRSFKILDEGDFHLQGEDFNTAFDSIPHGFGSIPEVIGTVEIHDAGPNFTFKSPMPYTNYVANDVSIGLIPYYACYFEVSASHITSYLNCDGRSDGSLVTADIHWYIIERIAGSS